MNCRDIEPLLHAEQDGQLTPRQQAELTQHVATCGACQQQRTQLRAALTAFRADAAAITVPDVDEAWKDLQNRLSRPASKPLKKRPLAPVIWFGTSLAAAAALALAYFGNFSNSTIQSAPVASSVRIAQADYVEAGDARATTMVFADQESGWLVVWATDAKAGSEG